MAAFVPDNLAGCNYPIETEIQKKFWGSRHKCNRAKAIIAFSYDKDNAMRNMRRIMGWMHFYRERAWNSFGHFVNTPDMSGIPFTEGNVGWWECMNGGGGIPPVNTKPTITITSPSTDMKVGSSYPLIARVTGTPTPTVKWVESGKEIGSGDSIVFTPTEERDYTFTVTATNSEGSASDSQTRTAVADAPPSLTWIKQLSDQTVMAGSTLVLEVLAESSDASPITYAWQDGSTGTTFTVDTTSAGDQTISCTATGTNTDPATISTSATISVEASTVAPTVIITSAADDMVAGTAYTLTATSTGKPTPTLAWTANGEDIGTGASVSFTPEYVMDYAFEVTATNSEGTATDSQTRKTTTPYSVLVAEDITDTVRGFNPANGSLTPSDIDGKPVLALEVDNSAGSIRLTLKNVGTPFDNISFEYYGVTYNLPIGKIGKYYQNSSKPLTAQLYEEMGKHLSKPTPIHFIPGPISKPIFTLQPKDVTVDVGDTATFTIKVTNADSLQWQENKSNKWEDITGATTDSYTTVAATADMDGWRYRCIATNTSGSTNSTVGFLTVNQPAVEETFGVKDISRVDGGNIFPDSGYDQFSMWSLANADYTGNQASLGYSCVAQEGDELIKATTWFDSADQKGIIGVFEKTADSLVKIYQSPEISGTVAKVLHDVSVDINPAIPLTAGKTYVVGYMSTDATGSRAAVDVDTRGDSIAWDANADANFSDSYTVADASDKGQAPTSYMTILRKPARRWDDNRNWGDTRSW